jgi:hypothetical protein
VVCQGFFVMILIVSASRMTSNHVMKRHVTSLVLYVNTVACCTYIYKLTYGVPQVSETPSCTPCGLRQAVVTGSEKADSGQLGVDAGYSCPRCVRPHP